MVPPLKPNDWEANKLKVFGTNKPQELAKIP
jgi:hypothetical protein